MRLQEIYGYSILFTSNGFFVREAFEKKHKGGNGNMRINTLEVLGVA